MIRMLLLICAIAAPAMADQLPRPVISEIIQEQTKGFRTFDGVIAPRHQIDLAFRTNGRLARLTVSTGDRVSAGDVLATLDQITLDQDAQAARAAVQSAQASFDLASAQLVRGQVLFDKGILSPAQLEQLQAANDGAKASLDSALAQADLANEAISFGTLTAPTDGIILDTSAIAGVTVAAGSPIISMADTSGIDAIIDVPSALLSIIEIGDQFDIEHQVSGVAPITAQLRVIEPVSEGKLDTRRLRLTLLDPTSDYRIGALVAARLRQDQTTVISIPFTALTEQSGETGVWRVEETPNRHAVFTPVTTGPQFDDRIVITGGLNFGDEIIVRGTATITNDQPIGDRIE